MGSVRGEIGKLMLRWYLTQLHDMYAVCIRFFNTVLWKYYHIHILEIKFRFSNKNRYCIPGDIQSNYLWLHPRGQLMSSRALGARYMQPEWLCPKVGGFWPLVIRWIKIGSAWIGVGVNKRFLLPGMCLYIYIYIQICILQWLWNIKLVLGVISYTSLIWGLVKVQSTNWSSKYIFMSNGYLEMLPQDAVWSIDLPASWGGKIPMYSHASRSLG